MSESAAFLTGHERLIGPAAPDEGAAILDFWRWAFSDLRQNTLRGIFAEWLVAKLLGLPLRVPRDPWTPADLQALGGVRIEVKSGAYLQAWLDSGRRSRPSWSYLAGRVWSADARSLAADATLNADLYVFCIQTMTNPQCWNALDLSQWEFFLLTREQVAAIDVRTISEPRLRSLAPALTAAQFQAAAAAAIQSDSASRDEP